MAQNKIEQLKREKDGLDVWPDLHRYAREGVHVMRGGSYLARWVANRARDGLDVVSEEDIERLKWYGLFHRLATSGFFMLRLRIPNGVLTSEQLAAVAEISERCGRSTADITTRQNIQLRWITIADAPWVLQRLAAAGLTSQQSGMDNVRNIVGCSIAGLDRSELFDARPLAARLQQAIVGHKGFSNLPRKFNLSITGCRESCTGAQTHDLSFVPATRNGVAGFNLLAGGALGGQDAALAEPLDAFVPLEQVIPATLAVLETFRAHGWREKRKQTRLKWLLRDWGIERFRAEIERCLGETFARAGVLATELRAGDHLGVRPQQQPGLNVVGLHVPVGRVTAKQLSELARLASSYGQGELRLTVQQNVPIPHVSDGRLGDLLTEPLLRDLSPNPSPFLRSVVACTGTDYCHYSLIDTKGQALRLARALDESYELDGALRIQVSGCPHACGQHRIGDVGLLGVRTRVEGEVREAADVFTGGRLGDDARLGSEVESGVLTEDLPGRVASHIQALRGPGALRPRLVGTTAVAGDDQAAIRGSEPSTP